jgi:hypothetical protein
MIAFVGEIAAAGAFTSGRFKLMAHKLDVLV